MTRNPFDDELRRARIWQAVWFWALWAAFMVSFGWMFAHGIPGK